jgi:hypothetical protein
MKRAHAAALLAVLLAWQACAEKPTAALGGGLYSAAGLYNLANSYALAGKPGMAVLNYERAALLAPNDADIEANLNSVRSSAHVTAAPHAKLEKLAHSSSPKGVALAGLMGVLIAGFGLLASVKFPRRRLLSVLVAAIGVAAMGFAACNAIFWKPKLSEAVVIAATTEMRATPVPLGDPLQQLAEAETVTITSSHEDFVLVRAPSGREGWVARADLADVVPGIAVR